MADNNETQEHKGRGSMLIGVILLMMLVFSIIQTFAEPLKGFVCIGICFILAGICIVDIKNRPPHVGLITIFNQLTSGFVREGLRFRIPYVYGYIQIDVEKKNVDLVKEDAIEVRTPDLAQLIIPISYTYTPDERNLVNYIRSGSQKKVEDIINDIIQQRVREWAIAPHLGPSNFKEALAAHDEAIDILIKSIIGKRLKEISIKDADGNDIHCPIPTRALTKYFDEPYRKPNKAEKKLWSKSNVTDPKEKDWGFLTDTLNSFCDRHVTPDRSAAAIKQDIEDQVNERKRLIDEIKAGDGEQRIVQNGIILNRLNIGEIKIHPDCALAKAAEKEAVEMQEARADKVEMNNAIQRIKSVMKGTRFTKKDIDKIFKNVPLTSEQIIQLIEDSGLSSIQSSNLFQTEREKKNVSKQIFEIPGLEKALPAILNSAITKALRGGE